MNFNNQCFVSPSDIIEIVDTITPRNINEYVNSYFVMVDNVDNVDEVKATLLKLGYDDIFIKNSMNVNLVNIITLSYTLLMTISFFTIIVFTISYIKKKIINETSSIGILRACGYNKKNLKNIYMLEIVITNLVAYIIGLVLFLLIYIILKSTLLHSLFNSGINIYLSAYVYVISFIIISIIPTCIINYFLIKLINSNIILLLKENG